jgi:eukaryotic sulfide quinone oxidoreductase
MLRAEGYKNLTIIEPKSVHYYQPLWTLVGGGLKKIEESSRPMSSILPKETKWIQNSIKSFDPKQDVVELKDGTKVAYDYLVVAIGIVARFDKIPGAEKALNDKDSGVVSIYDPNYAVKTAHVLDELKQGKTIFTMPTTPVILLASLSPPVFW